MSSGPLYLPASYEDIPHIAVCAGRHPPNVHAGIIFRSGSGEMKLLDIDINGRISANPASARPFDKYAWAIPQFPPLALEQLAAYCEHLGNKSPNVGYSFRLLHDTLLVDDGHDITLEGANGLTCATFVIAVFQSNYRHLVDIASWEHRDEDDQKQREMVAFMEKNAGRYYGLTRERIDAARSEIGCLRYRPEETVGACLVGDHPTRMEKAAPAGVDTLAWLDHALGMLKRA